jgi:hypothetical protein
MSDSRGDNVEDAFLETATKIYQNIQDGRYSIRLSLRNLDAFLLAVSI